MYPFISLLAQSTTYYTSDYNSSGSEAASFAVFLVILFFMGIVIVAFYVFYAICLMKIFKKAGRTDTWAAWVPIYSQWVYFEICGHPGWWALLSMISPLNIVLAVLAGIDLAKAFKKDTTYGVLLLGLFSFIGLPMLAFSDAQYSGVPVSDFNFGGTVPPSNPPQPPVSPVA